MKYAKAIKKLADKYIQKYDNVKSAWDINNGLCEEFAKDFLKQNAQWADEFIIVCSEIFDEDLPGHIWLLETWTGLHYDAEHPNGVAHYKELSIFK